LTCGFVAELLGFPIATLASLLKVLEERGLVSTDAHSGLRLTDLAGLEKLARA
jgi:DNA-binding IclR family transcriptional regulator